MFKFWYELFEVLRRKFPWPEQSANGVSDKELMRALDCKESEERMQMDTKHFHEKHIMTVIDAAATSSKQKEFFSTSTCILT